MTTVLWAQRGEATDPGAAAGAAEEAAASSHRTADLAVRRGRAEAPAAVGWEIGRRIVGARAGAVAAACMVGLGGGGGRESGGGEWRERACGGLRRLFVWV